MLDGTNATTAYVDKDGFAVASPTFAYDGTARACAKTSLTYTGKDLKKALTMRSSTLIMYTVERQR